MNTQCSENLIAKHHVGVMLPYLCCFCCHLCANSCHRFCQPCPKFFLLLFLSLFLNVSVPSYSFLSMSCRISSPWNTIAQICNRSIFIPKKWGTICSDCPHEDLCSENIPLYALENGLCIGGIPAADASAILNLPECLLIGCYFAAVYITRLYPQY